MTAIPRRLAATTAMLLGAALLAGCGTDVKPGDRLPDSDVEEATLPGLAHVHGLGINPADDALMIATHFGLWRIEDSDEPERVGDAAHDFMGFSVTGPDRFVASGHPRGARELPPHLGLIRSTDAGTSWRSVSLLGEADFHVLRVGRTRTYGWSSTSGELMSSDDDTTWKRLGRHQLVDLVVDPTDDTRLLASHARSETTLELRRSTNGGRTWKPIRKAPQLVRLSWTSGDAVWGVEPDGDVWRSTDSGDTWTRRGELPAGVEAITASDDTWVAAAGGALHESADDGTTWSVLHRYE